MEHALRTDGFHPQVLKFCALTGIAFAILIAQLCMTLSLLALAVYAFSRREIIFSGN